MTIWRFSIWVFRQSPRGKVIVTSENGRHNRGRFIPQRQHQLALEISDFMPSHFYFYFFLINCDYLFHSVQMYPLCLSWAKFSSLSREAQCPLWTGDVGWLTDEQRQRLVNLPRRWILSETKTFTCSNYKFYCYFLLLGSFSQTRPVIISAFIN